MRRRWEGDYASLWNRGDGLPLLKGDDLKQYMVIEHFAPNAKEKIYQRFREKGRMLPEGLNYIDSWLEKDGDRCFQLMETNEPSLFDRWMENWRDLVRFEIVELGEKPEEITE